MTVWILSFKIRTAKISVSRLVTTTIKRREQLTKKKGLKKIEAFSD